MVFLVFFRFVLFSLGDGGWFILGFYENNMGFMRDNFIGNLIIKFEITFPKELSQSVKKELEKLL